MLKQCFTLLKHAKTVVNPVWLRSGAIQPFFCNHMKCLQNSWNALWARVQEPCEPISLSLTPSLALFWPTRPLLGSQRRCHAAALYPALEMSLPWKLENWAELLQHGHLSLKYFQVNLEIAFTIATMLTKGGGVASYPQKSEYLVWPDAVREDDRALTWT